MRSWLWLERSGLAPESGRAQLQQLEKGIMDKRAKRKGIMAIVGRFVTLLDSLFFKGTLLRVQVELVLSQGFQHPAHCYESCLFSLLCFLLFLLFHYRF